MTQKRGPRGPLFWQCLAPESGRSPQGPIRPPGEPGRTVFVYLAVRRRAGARRVTRRAVARLGDAGAFLARRLTALRAGALFFAAFRAGARFLVALRAGARLVAFLAVARFLVVRLAAFRAGARLAVFRAVVRFTALRAVVRLAAFRAGARFAVFLARLTAMLYALLTAFLADRFIAFLAGARPAAFLADCFAAFLAGARVVFLTGARPTTFFDARPAVLLTAFLVEFLVALVATLFVVLVVAFFAVALDDFFAGPVDTFSAGGAALPLRTSLSIPLAAKRTPRDAEMLTGAPVRGLRPLRAPRCVGLKLPKPATTTRRPERTSFETTWTSALTASSASRFANDVVLLTASISPDLFTAPPPGNAISTIKEGFRGKSKHLRESAPRGARRRARSCARSTARKQRVAGRVCGATTDITDARDVMATDCLWTGKAVFARIFDHAAAS